MQGPASLVPLKNIFLVWTESSDQSALNRPLSTWSEAEDANPHHGRACVRPGQHDRGAPARVPGRARAPVPRRRRVGRQDSRRL